MRGNSITRACTFAVATSLLSGSVAFGGFLQEVTNPNAPSTALDPLVIEFTNAAGNVFRTVNVTNIGATDTPAMKSFKIVDAINKAPTQGVSALQGVQSPEKFTLQGTKGYRFKSDPTGEDLDKVSKGTAAPGAPPAVELDFNAWFGGSATATGQNPQGSLSVVRLGVEGLYVAQLNPASGSPATSILSSLRQDLSNHGISLTLTGNELSFDQPLLASQTLVWGNTDTGFDSYAAVSEVPEPTSIAAATAGVGILTIRRRRRD